MEMKRLLSGLLAAWVLLAPLPEPPHCSAQSAVLYDCTAKRVLWGRNEDKPSLIASTTKIMTALVILENCKLSEPVQIPEEAVGVEGSSVYLQKGECLTVEELLLGLMLQSGNDAAVALAVHCAGSIPAFAAKMNATAERLEMRQSHFVNPNGLDHPDHYSTALDLAYLTSYALQNPDFARIVSTKQATISGNRCLHNHNKLLWRYDGCIGVKTGYTRAAGRILVSAAERDGRRLVVVTIGDSEDWNDHCRLLDYGFLLTVNGSE